MSATFWAAQAAQKSEGALRKVLVKCYQHGRKILQGVYRKGETTTGKEKDVGSFQIQGQRLEIKGPVIIPRGTQQNIKPNVFGGLVYRTNVQSLAGQLRKRAALKFLGGNIGKNVKRTPIFAFVSLALSANQTFERTEDPSETVFSQIREMFKARTDIPGHTDDVLPTEIGLDDLEFGKMINKGCNAAVYEARLKTDPHAEEELSWTELQASLNSEADRFIIETDRPVGDESVRSTLSLSPEDEEMNESDISIISDVDQEGSWINVDEDGDMAVFSIAPVLTEEEMYHSEDSESECCHDDDYDLAVKMMFNYDVESNSDAILRAMEKEAVPAKSQQNQTTEASWENGNRVKKKKNLPPHPNIVDMKSVFVGCVPLLEGALTQFPDALPPSHNPEGFGRNQTMFLIMKRYSHTLREYLNEKKLSLQSSLLLFGQLLEGVVHIVQHGIAHRDLKSDNILIQEKRDSAHLVISDFGCCLAEEGGLKMPYLSDDMFRGGNRALMAPEIAGAVPGKSSQLEYSQSDVWAAGAMGYEIFGMDNPFYNGEMNRRLDSLTYTEDQLPQLPDEIPEAIKRLVKSLLVRDPKTRPIPEVAANMVHLYLWAPDEWLSGKRPSREEVVQWLLTLSARVLCQEKVRVGRSRCFRRSSNVTGSWSDVEFQLVRLFLSRVQVDEMMETIEML